MHWPATLKVSRVSKREHVPSVPVDTLLSASQAIISNIPSRMPSGKGLKGHRSLEGREQKVGT